MSPTTIPMTSSCKSARSVFKKDDNPPLSGFDRETQSELFMHGATVGYGSALGYGQFFMYGEGGKYRQAFFKYVKAVYQGLGGPGLFEATFGRKASTFQSEAEKYMKKF